MPIRHGRAAPAGPIAAVMLILIAGAATDAEADGAPVWVLEGTTNSVYLAGSIHLLRESDYPLPQPLLEAYGEAEALVMELDMDDIDRAMVGAVMFARGTPPEGETLASMLGPEKFALAQESAAAMGFDLTRMQGAEPWYAALTLTQLQLMRRGYDPRYGVDAHLAATAMRDGKPIRGLETFEEQIRFFDELPLPLQADMLLESLAEIGDLEEDMGVTVTAWRRGDAGFLARELLAELGKYPELYRVLVVERNRRWLPEIMSLADRDDDYLVIVGALHLVGEDGLLALLEAQGVKTAQLPSPTGGAESRPTPRD